MEVCWLVLLLYATTWGKWCCKAYSTFVVKPFIHCPTPEPPYFDQLHPTSVQQLKCSCIPALSKPTRCTAQTAQTAAMQALISGPENLSPYLRI